MIRLMIIDDDILVRKYISQMVSWESHEIEIVGEAIHGRHAISQIKELKPDVMIVDVSMPVMDGVELIRHINNEGLRIATIMLSCQDDFAFVHDSLKLGAFDYVLKHSFQAEQMVELVKNAYAKTFMEKPEKHSDDKLDTRINLAMPPGDIKILEESIINNRRDIWEKLLKKYYKSIRDFNATSEQIYSFFMEVITVINKIILIQGVAAETIYKDITPYEALQKKMEVEKSWQWLIKLVEQLSYEIARFSKGLHQNTEINKAVKYIEENYQQSITLQDLANHVNLSKNYLSQLFKQVTGANITEYILNYRIQEAKRILKESEAKVYDIAVQVGFKNQYYFIRAFKKVVGITPDSYRKSM